MHGCAPYVCAHVDLQCAGVECMTEVYACMYACMRVCLSVCLSVSLSVCHLSVRLSVCPSVRLSVDCESRPPVRPPGSDGCNLCVSVSMCLYLSEFVSLSLPFSPPVSFTLPRTHVCGPLENQGNMSKS